MSIEDKNYVHKANIDIAESALKPQEPIRAAFVSIPENQRKKATDRSNSDLEELDFLVKVCCIREPASKNTFARNNTKIRVAEYTINTLNIVVGVYLLKVTVAHPMCCMSNCSRLSLQIWQSKNVC